MEKIASFTIDHSRMERGLFVSRKDTFGDTVLTTIDIRMKRPNREPVMNTAEAHTIEHLGATYLRSHPEYAAKTVYFGPMGCRTGFYWVVEGDLTSRDLADIITQLFAFMADYEGEVPGADAVSCGNWLDMNLPMARLECRKFLVEVLLNLQEENLEYPH